MLIFWKLYEDVFGPELTKKTIFLVETQMICNFDLKALHTNLIGLVGILKRFKPECKFFHNALNLVYKMVNLILCRCIIHAFYISTDPWGELVLKNESWLQKKCWPTSKIPWFRKSSENCKNMFIYLKLVGAKEQYMI